MIQTLALGQRTEFNPFEAFQIVSELDRDVKNMVKTILLQICKMGGNFVNRVDIAQQIFQRTNIEYYPVNLTL